MNMLRNILFVAVLAGLPAGVVMTGLQAASTVPLILQAETFEAAGDAAEAPHDLAAPHHDHAAMSTPAAEPAHEHDPEAWSPADGFQRSAFTFLANVVTAIGFGLLLTVATEFAGGIGTWRQGLVWGLAGFATFTLAPNLGLPPELPAMPAADLVARQIWWIGTVAATGAGLALLTFGRSAGLALLGAALLITPHLIGAPQPLSHDSPIPADLHHRFIVAVTVTNLLFWLLLGAAVALVRPRFAAGLDTGQPRLA